MSVFSSTLNTYGGVPVFLSDPFSILIIVHLSFGSIFNTYGDVVVL